MKGKPITATEIKKRMKEFKPEAHRRMQQHFIDTVCKPMSEAIYNVFVAPKKKTLWERIKNVFKKKSLKEIFKNNHTLW